MDADKDQIYSSVGFIIIGLYRDNIEVSEESVVKRLENMVRLTDEMRSYISPAVAKWVQHLEQKKREYVPKSKCVNWLTDATYDLEVR